MPISALMLQVLKLKGSPEVYQILLDELLMIARNLAGSNFSGTVSITPNETVELRISLNSFSQPNPPLTKLFSTNADVHNTVDVDAFGLAPVVAKKNNQFGWGRYFSFTNIW